MAARLRLAAVGDLHCRTDAWGRFRNLVAAVNDAGCDALLLCGDLTDHGTREEARTLAEVLRGVRVPIVGVLGNHDHDAGLADEVVAILRDAGVSVLDGDRVILRGGLAGVAGAKGFCGGFERSTLQSFGEAPIKAFVQEGVREALKLEAALSILEPDVPVKIVLTHYAPIAGTCHGERPELFPFLGTSRLAEPLDAYGVTAAFHGHAHHGTAEARTRTGVPVHNVALPLLVREDPARRIRLVELELPEPPPSPHP